MATVFEPANGAMGLASPTRRDHVASKTRTEAPDALSSRSQAALNTLIEGEIIPQLLAAHQTPRRPLTPRSAARIDREEVRRFAPLPLVLEADELFEHVDRFLARGVSAESIYVDLLAPSARKLGELWESDSCDFVDVTLGLWRLQEVMREIAWRSPAITKRAFADRTALFTPMPGEQHSFGSLMVEETFARAGWQSESLLEPQRRDLLAAIAGRYFDLIGLTVSCDCHSGALAELVRAIRSVSRNPDIVILVGGRVINADPSLADLCGADGTAPDAASALALAERLVVAPAGVALAC